MPVTVKICGLSTPETLDAALDAGAEMVGLMFFPASPRHLSLGAARDLAARVKGRAQKVAVSVDADDAALENAIDAVRPDLLQLHGKETTARIRDIKARFGVPVMKVISVETSADLNSAAGYAAVADRILFDARAPKDATRPGGLGVPFDWRLLENLKLAVPYMVSGGINAGNVADALRVTRAPGVDVSSGVESAPGVKDIALIRAFIAAVRGVEQASAPDKILRSGT
jgi:phosphoribosylanthranilate isomerase